MASISARGPPFSLPPQSFLSRYPLPSASSLIPSSAAVASSSTGHSNNLAAPITRRGLVAATMSTVLDGSSPASVPRRPPMTIDSHLHVWASPQQAADRYPYHPGQEPTLRGDADFLLECMEDAGVDGALIVQPINHKFDHSLVTSILKKHPSKFVGCCLANPLDDGSGVDQLEHLVLKDGFRAVRFNPYLWPTGQKMTNDVGKALFRKAGELRVPVGVMCMKGLGLHIEEIEELCTEFPSTVVLLDHMGFCRPPTNNDESKIISRFLELSKYPQVYVKFSALFRISRKPFPYEDTLPLLSQVVSSFGASRVMWGSDFPFVVPECGYKGAKEAISIIASQIPVGSSDLEWILGRTVMELFQDCWMS